MPADRSVDLAVLDALFAAATPGEWETDSEKTDEGYKTYVMFAPDGSRLFDALNSSATLVQYDYGDDGGSEWDETARRNFALIAALHNAWPAIKRRLEIGDAAVAWAEKALAHWDLSNKTIHAPNGAAELERKSAEVEIDLAHLSLEAAVALGEYDAARAKLRALREAQNG